MSNKLTNELSKRLSKKAEVTTYILIALLVLLFLFYLIPRLIDLKYSPSDLSYGQNETVFTADSANSNRLKYAPPGGSYQKMSYSQYKNSQRWKKDSNTNIEIDLGNQILKEPLEINGGRNIKVIGGEIQIDNQSGWNGENGRMGIKIVEHNGWQTGERTVFIEGVKIHDGGKNWCTSPGSKSNCSDLSEGVQIAAPNTHVVLQNIHIEGIHYRDAQERDGQNGKATVHPDVIQVMGGYKTIKIDKLTGVSPYQGLFIKNDRNQIQGDVFINRMNLKGINNSQYLFWTSADNNYSVDLNDVYLDYSSSSGKNSLRNVIFFSDKFNFNGNVSATGKSNSTRPETSGKIYSGKPSGGDFVPSWVAGRSYNSPGYQNGSATSSSSSGASSSTSGSNNSDLRIILYNASTNNPINGFNPMSRNETLNIKDFSSNNFGIVAEINNSNVRSVKFSGGFTKTENIAPYSVFGDSGNNINGRSLQVRTYNITAKAYSGSNGGGSLIDTETVTLEVIDNSTYTSGGGTTGGSSSTTSSSSGSSGADGSSNTGINLYLIDPDTNEPVFDYSPILSGTTINLANLNDDRFGFEARSNNDNTESIRFQGAFGTRNENVAPYSYFGDSNGQFSTRDLTPGNYEITITSFSRDNGGGSILEQKEIDFVVIDNGSGGSTSGSSTGGGNPTGYEVTLSTRDNSVASISKMRATSNYVYQSYTTSNINNAGTLELDFNLAQSGNYKIVGRVKTNGNSSNEVWINMNSNPSNSQVWEINNGSGTRDVDVVLSGSNPAIFNLNSGQNTLVIKGKEKNVHMYEFTLVKVN